MLNFIAFVQVLPDVTCVERAALGPCSTRIYIYIYLGRLHMKRIKMLFRDSLESDVFAWNHKDTWWYRFKSGHKYNSFRAGG